MGVLIVALLGLAMGSFIDALTWRIYQQEFAPAKKKLKKTDKLSILKGRSMCEHCHHQLNAADLIPLFSWLSLGGRCRYCRKPIGWQSPVIELVTAALFGLSYQQIGLYVAGDSQAILAFGVWLLLLVGLIAMAVFDLCWMIIPNRIVLPLIVVAGAWVLAQAALFAGGAERIREAVIGLAVGGGFFYGLFVVSKGRWIGGGDVKLGFLMGLALGPLKSLVALLLAFNGALLVLLPFMLTKRLKRGQAVPFGPFLIAAIIVARLYGQELFDWYNTTFLYSNF